MNETVGSYGKCTFHFKRKVPVFQSGCTILYPQTMYECFSCSPSFQHLVLLFNFSHFDGYIGISLQFSFSFLWWLVMLDIFLHVYWPSIYLLLWSVCCPFKTSFINSRYVFCQIWVYITIFSSYKLLFSLNLIFLVYLISRFSLSRLWVSSVKECAFPFLIQRI